MLVAAGLAGSAAFIVTKEKNVAAVAAGVGALIGLGTALYERR